MKNQKKLKSSNQDTTSQFTKKFAWRKSYIEAYLPSVPTNYPHSELDKELSDEQSFLFEKEHISYFNNPQQVAKDFKKVLQFFAAKDEQLQNKLLAIKHTHILYYCAQILGYLTFEEWRKNDSINIEKITKKKVFEKLKEFLIVKLDITSALKHTEYLYFFMSLVFIEDISKDLSNLKTKMKYRLDKIEDFINLDVSKESSSHLIMEEMIESEQITLYREILSTRYRYVWSLDYLQNFVETPEVYRIQFFQDLLLSLPKLCVLQNLCNFTHSEAEETYYISEHNYDYIEDLLFSSVSSKKYHAGLDMSGAQKKIDKMRISFINNRYGLSAHKIFFEPFYDEYCVYLTDKSSPLYIRVLADAIVFKQNDQYCFENYDSEAFRLILAVRIAKNVVSSRNFKIFYPKTLNDELILYLKGEENEKNCLKIGLNHLILNEEGRQIKLSYDELIKKMKPLLTVD